MNSKLLGVSALALVAAAFATPAFAIDADAAATDASSVDTLIVTGTRTTGLKAVDSAAPIEVLGADALKHVGQPNLIQGLAQLVPSFTAEAFGGDTANQTLSARLRGLSPNDTLVLVNGKRRHPTGNLHVLGGPYQGAATADLDLIPVAAIDHVEVLQDGAAAQYGTDAIAGVVNIILKQSTHGGVLSATGGSYYAGDGHTGAVSAQAGFDIGGKGFIDLVAEYRYHGFSQRGGADQRVSNADGSIKAGITPAWASIAGYPRLNHILGDARTSTYNIGYNMGYELNDIVSLYSFGTYGHKWAQAYENYRVPSRVIASPVLGVAGTYTAPGELIFAPNGFNPKETLREDDFALTGGVKFTIAGWNVDLSTTYGRDHDAIGTADSANASLFVDTHATPTLFYDGAFITSQWTNTLDFSKDFDAGWAKPINFAFGVEQRFDSYEIQAGDAASIYKEGAQSYPGFQPTDAAHHSRRSWAIYGDLAASPIQDLKLDLAVRHENFSDFGDTTVWKATARYDFNDTVAIRGTAATGFRAPSMAEEFYSATNVSPTSATVQLPANSAAAALLGFSTLKPERSHNYSVGIVLHPGAGMSVTLDAYQIDIRDRIVGTGTILGKSGGVTISPAVLAAIAAHGNILDNQVTFQGVSVFTNGIDTQTRGAELTVIYTSDFGDKGKVDWTLAGNYNTTRITHVIATPAPILPQALFGPTALTQLQTGAPKTKIGFGALWTMNKWTVNLRETIYGPTSITTSPDGTGTFAGCNGTSPGTVGCVNKIGAKGITDLEIGYAVTDELHIAAGANNLFNTRPTNRIQFPPTGGLSDGSNIYDAPNGFSPFGINGGYYYGRVTYAF
jgi:iron complex outermembrane receptor protein